ncbi:MAG: SCP2 sterol-binding domain-containing protein [Acidimicrobiales bacterium]
MARYLSPEWLAELQAAAAGAEPSLTGLADVVLQHEVTGASGDVVFHVVIGDEGIAVLPGPADGATVTFTEDDATAAAITRGELSAQTAYMSGRLRIRGDVTALARPSSIIVALDDLFAAVRSSTTYPGE